ncbi:hypothetical protein J6590_002996 [Homalodisca vitripennis]|nr:hypothetical protein J6590_002996 [Homalodisca vitripennis]
MVQCCIEALVCQCSITVPTTTLHLNERFESSESEVKRLQCKGQEACCGAMLYRSTRVSESEVKRMQGKSQEACCGAMLYRSTRVSV